jgi:hypothetical protein
MGVVVLGVVNDVFAANAEEAVGALQHVLTGSEISVLRLVAVLDGADEVLARPRGLTIGTVPTRLDLDAALVLAEVVDRLLRPWGAENSRFKNWESEGRGALAASPRG